MATAASTLTAEDLRGIPSVPESAISEALAARLPEAVPAPWTTSGSGLVWLHRAAPEAAGHHQRGLEFTRSVPVTVGAFLRYDEGPVGAYDEVLGAPTMVARERRLSLPVAFMAVDSEASIAGGRSNWALPKTLASFQWETAGRTPAQLTATGDLWAVQARVRWSGPRMPLWLRASTTQVRADGAIQTVPISSRGVGRLARVEVSAEGPTLSSWLLAGVHMGVVVERVTHTIGPATLKLNR
jgi:hypothetical protein